MIEEADWSNLTIEFEKFPKYSRGDVLTLAKYLIDAGYDTPTYMIFMHVNGDRVH